MSDIDLDDIIVEFDDGEPDGEALSLEKVPARGVTEAKFDFDEPYDVSEGLRLVDEPEKLFAFKEDSTLNAVQKMYIIAYATKGTKKGACEIAGISYGVVKKWLENEEFSEALEDAVSITHDSLEEEMLKRAMNGSDKLLLEALKAMKPEKYQTRSQQNVNVKGEVVHTWADLAQEAAKEAGEMIEDVEYEEAE